MAKRVASDQAAYKQLLQTLIVQGLIKLMEEDVWIKCRKSDLSLVRSVVDSAKAQYKEVMEREVKKYQGKDIPLVIHVSDEKFLPEYKEGAQDSCIGGVQMFANQGRIVCSNTLDERLQLAYAESIPSIRKNLFPSFKKKRA